MNEKYGRNDKMCGIDDDGSRIRLIYINLLNYPCLEVELLELG